MSRDFRRSSLEIGAALALAGGTALVINATGPPEGKPGGWNENCKGQLDTFEHLKGNHYRAIGMTASAACANVYDRITGNQQSVLEEGDGFDACYRPSEPYRLHILNRYTDLLHPQVGFVYLSPHAQQTIVSGQIHIPKCPPFMSSKY